MSDLTPVLRPDYTGKLVTRHMRMDSGNASPLGIPAPVASEFSAEIGRIESRLLDILAAAASEEDEGDWGQRASAATYLDTDTLLSADKIRGAISRLPKRTIARIDEKLANEFDPDEDYPIVLLHALTHNGNDPQLIEYMTYFHSSVDDIYDGEDLDDLGANSYAILYDCLNGLRHYQHFGYTPPEDIYQSTDEERDTAQALCTLRFTARRLVGFDLSLTGTTKVDTGGEFESHIVSSEAFVKVMMERPDDRQRLIGLIDERDSNDPELIMAILDTPSPAVAEGIL